MIFDLQNWLDQLTIKLKDAFGKRIVFIGYQGSYRRGEATQHSDIDMVVILESLELSDLEIYKRLINEMPFSEKACGFISGKKELLSWPQGDVFQLINDTTAIYGNLENLFLPISKESIQNHIINSSANLYHMACHCYLYDENPAKSLAELYKMSFFILQALYYIEKGDYISKKQELLSKLDGINFEILNTCLKKEQMGSFSNNQIKEAYEQLILWCSENFTITK